MPNLQSQQNCSSEENFKKEHLTHSSPTRLLHEGNNGNKWQIKPLTIMYCTTYFSYCFLYMHPWSALSSELSTISKHYSNTKLFVEAVAQVEHKVLGEQNRVGRNTTVVSFGPGQLCNPRLPLTTLQHYLKPRTTTPNLCPLPMWRMKKPYKEGVFKCYESSLYRIMYKPEVTIKPPKH